MQDKDLAEPKWEDLAWIGVEKALTLRSAGIHSLRELAFTSVDTLARAGLPAEESRRLVEKACSELKSMKRGSSLEISWQARRRISSGSKHLDMMLGGGVPTGRVVDFFGPSGVGKTQICLQLCVNACSSTSHRGEPLIAIYVDTAGTFRPERVFEIAQCRGKDAEDVLKRIYTYPARSIEDQMAVTNGIVDLSLRAPLGLVVVDTLTENFIYQTGEQIPLLQRQSLLGRHLNQLARLALLRNVAVVVTNTVRALARDEQESMLVEVGASASYYGPHLRVLLERKEGKRRATLLKPPSYPWICFEIRGEGVADC